MRPADSGTNRGRRGASFELPSGRRGTGRSPRPSTTIASPASSSANTTKRTSRAAARGRRTPTATGSPCAHAGGLRAGARVFGSSTPGEVYTPLVPATWTTIQERPSGSSAPEEAPSSAARPSIRSRPASAGPSAPATRPRTSTSSLLQHELFAAACRHRQDLARRRPRRIAPGAGPGGAPHPEPSGGGSRRKARLPARRHAREGRSVSASDLRRAYDFMEARHVERPPDRHDRDRSPRLHARAHAHQLIVLLAQNTTPCR